MAEKLLFPRNSDDSDKSMGFTDELSSFTGVVFGFLEEQKESSSISSFDSVDFDIEDEENENPHNFEERKEFWETQNQLLQATLYRTTSLEMEIREATKEAVKEIKQQELHCRCHTPPAEDCRSFLQRELSLRLQAQGYNCAICKSKWKSSSEILSGEHTYLEVVENLNSKKGEVRVVIELNFLGEFEMAKASEEYNKLINQLPKIFVGKSERLKALIKILCLSGKKCMKEKRMYLAPWRKQKYMQSKWLGTFERTTPVIAPLPPMAFSDRLVAAKPKASMLTYDMLETLPVMHRATVKVL